MTVLTLSFSVFCRFPGRACRVVTRWSAACRRSVRFPPNAHECGQVWQYTHRGSFWGRHLDGVAGTPSFPLGRRVSLALVAVAAAGANLTLLRRLLGGCAFALAFLREAFACLDVACSAAASLAPSRRCRVSGALKDDLLLITGLAPLLETNLRGKTLREPLPYRCLTRWCWRVRRVHHAGGLARPVRFGRRKGERTFALIGRAKNHQATCIMVVQRLRRLRLS